MIPPAHNGFASGFEVMDLEPSVNVIDAEYNRLLGYPPGHELSERASELAGQAREWYSQNGKPWIYARQVPFHLSPGKVAVNGTAFSSQHLHDQFASAEANEGVLVLVTAGKACEERARQLWQEGKPDEYFFQEMFGSAVVENLIAQTNARICAWAEQQGMAALPHYSPGYSSWDVSDQNKLFSLITHFGRNQFPETIQVLDSGMVRPKKSLLAVLGLTRRPELFRQSPNLVPCHQCSYSPSQYRRAPYRTTPPQVEDVARLQAKFAARPIAAAESKTAALHPAPRYSIHHRALKKWSTERLQLITLEDRSLQARFRYEGTTCSNLGRPIRFDYYLKLAPREQQYRIIETGCVPSPGDTGHKHMCEYLRDKNGLMTTIRGEKPMIGRPLAEIFSWQRANSPAGCYCDGDSRKHKWGLVFEVIHYGLAQLEKEQSSRK